MNVQLCNVQMTYEWLFRSFVVTGQGFKKKHFIEIAL